MLKPDPGLHRVMRVMAAHGVFELNGDKPGQLSCSAFAIASYRTNALARSLLLSRDTRSCNFQRLGET